MQGKDGGGMGERWGRGGGWPLACSFMEDKEQRGKREILCGLNRAPLKGRCGERGATQTDTRTGKTSTLTGINKKNRQTDDRQTKRQTDRGKI